MSLCCLDSSLSEFPLEYSRDHLQNLLWLWDKILKIRSVFKPFNRCELNRRRYCTESFTLELIHRFDKLWHFLRDDHESHSPASSSEPLGSSVGNDSLFGIELSDAWMTFICESQLRVNFIGQNIDSIFSWDSGNILELLSSEDGTSGVVWIIQQQEIVLALQLLVSLFKIYQEVIWINVVIFVPSEFRLRNIRHPRWVWQDEVAVEDVLETIDELLGAWTDNHLWGIDWSLGIFFIPFGDSFP